MRNMLKKLRKKYFIALTQENLIHNQSQKTEKLILMLNQKD